MTLAAGILSELHRIHRQLSDLRDRLERGPKQIAASEAVVKRGEAEIAATKETYKRARIASDEKQLQLKQREARIGDLQVKLNQSDNNREYQAFKEQIAADLQANSVLSDEILEGLEHLDVIQGKIALLEANLAKTRADSLKVQARVTEQQAALESEHARVAAELAQNEALLPEDFRKDYERIARVRGENSLAPLEGESCGSCFQMLPPQMINDVRLSRPVFCKSCGCLLYKQEE